MTAGYKVTLSERAVDRTPGNAETLRDRRGTQRGTQLVDAASQRLSRCGS